MNRLNTRIIALELERLTHQEHARIYLERVSVTPVLVYRFNADGHEVWFSLKAGDLEKSLDDMSRDVLMPIALQWLNRQGRNKETPREFPIGCDESYLSTPGDIDERSL